MFGFFCRYKGLLLLFIVQYLFHALPVAVTYRLCVSRSWSYIFIHCCIPCEAENFDLNPKCNNKLCFQKALVHFLQSI